MAEEQAVIALLYDFDKTLCTKDMQEYTFIPRVEMSAAEFWRKSNGLSESDHMDKILAYMYTMLREADHMNLPIRREDFEECGTGIEYYPGVETWFDRINQFGAAQGVTIEHYIISSGLKEIIEGSVIGREFTKIYACEFYYNVNGTAVWPLNVVNYTGKTQYLFRINKGILDISNDVELNAYTPEGQRRVPFRNMIYFGDGMTDVPCMRLVHTNGGRSIAVYPEGSAKGHKKALELLRDDRVDYVEPADYQEAGSLEQLVKQIICSMTITHELLDISAQQRSKVRKKEVD